MNQEVIKVIEEFLRKMDSFEIEFIPNISDIQYKQKTYGSKEEFSGTLSDHLSHAIADYRMYEDSNTRWRNKYIHDCLEWITRAQTTGAFRPSQNIINKYKESQAENEKLKNDVLELSTRYQELSESYKELKGHYDELNQKVAKYFPLKDT